MVESEYDKGYIQGFYSALKGSRFVAETAESKSEIIEAIDDTLDEMRKAGELDDIDTGVDELIEIISIADKAGVVDKIFDALDDEIKKHEGNK